jgi:hypothetical protein
MRKVLSGCAMHIGAALEREHLLKDDDWAGSRTTAPPHKWSFKLSVHGRGVYFHLFRSQYT